jgi:hypothetical protein
MRIQNAGLGRKLPLPSECVLMYQKYMLSLREPRGDVNGIEGKISEKHPFAQPGRELHWERFAKTTLVCTCDMGFVKTFQLESNGRRFGINHR